MLLRVGMDKGVWQGRVSDGAYAPIFADGSFQFIPKSEETRIPKSEVASHNWGNLKTYEETVGIKTGKPLSTFLPEKLWRRHPHSDPEFEMFSYGDDTKGKRPYLLKLEKEDLLVFYAGLKPFQTDKYEDALYSIAYFTVEKVLDFNILSKREIRKSSRLHPNNAHVKHKLGTDNLVIVVGNKRESKLLDKAILLSQRKIARDGRYYHAVSAEMERELGIKGFIQKSIPPRFISKAEYVENLKRILGIMT